MTKTYKTLRVPSELIEVLERIRKNVDEYTYSSLPRITYADLMRILAKKVNDTQLVK